MTGIRQEHKRGCSGNGRCRCPWQAEVYDKHTRKRRRKTFPSREAAKTWREDTQARIKLGTLGTSSKVTVAEAVDRFLDEAESGAIAGTGSKRPYKPATLRNYRLVYRKHVGPVLGQVRVTSLTRSHIQAMLSGMYAKGVGDSYATVSVALLKVVYRRAIREGLVVVDPTQHLELRPTPAHRRRKLEVPSPAEAMQLILALPRQEQAYWGTAMYGGLRSGS